MSCTEGPLSLWLPEPSNIDRPTLQTHTHRLDADTAIVTHRHSHTQRHTHKQVKIFVIRIWEPSNIDRPTLQTYTHRLDVDKVTHTRKHSRKHKHFHIHTHTKKLWTDNCNYFLDESEKSCLTWKCPSPFQPGGKKRASISSIKRRKGTAWMGSSQRTEFALDCGQSCFAMTHFLFVLLDQQRQMQRSSLTSF